jgi:threonine/homoserine/homoserine lactone efflux protein
MFLKGLVIGLAIAVPVGPVGFLCLRRTLVYGRVTGIVSGLGAATADALYGLVVAFGLTAIASFLLRIEPLLQLGGGVFLLGLGLRTARARPPAMLEGGAPQPQRSLPAAYFSTLALTVGSPATILAFLAIFAGFGLGGRIDTPLHAFELVGGVFTGSALWWLGLGLGAGALRDRLHEGALRVVHAVSGGAIALLGIWQLGLLARSVLR